MKRGLLATALALALLGSVPARADFSQYLNATCGPACADPIGEQAAARDSWSALSAMGTTQWIGSNLGGTTIDASSLLAASRVAGATELDRWLNSGEASSTDVAQAMSDALRSYAGLDVTLITGVLPKAADANGAYPSDTSGYGLASNGSSGFPSIGSLGSSGSSGSSGFQSDLQSGLGTAASLTSTLGGGGGIGGALGTAASLTGALTGGGASALGGGSGYCAQSIDQAQNANAKKYVQAMQQIATSGDYGFTQNGGKPISSGSPSGSGYYKGGCLDQLMQGTRDMLFKPPGLSSLLSQLGGMFGGGGGGSGGGSGGSGCGATPSILSQIQKSMPSSIFNAGQGGFLPAAAFGGGGLTGGSALSSLASSQAITPRTIQSLFSR